MATERGGWGLTDRSAGWSPALACWPEGHALARPPLRLARKAALSLALAVWFLIVSALGSVVATPPYSAPASTPVRVAPRLPAPIAAPPGLSVAPRHRV
ncbi:MAG TPA: hypothetical protein VGY97_05735 [Solirubrobacteraceae bacterium]|nr:hypothetical protein [Solirubrobacteraceae bacterium]